MVEKFDKYWTKIHGVMGVATVLDYLYKWLLEYYFPLLYGAKIAKMKIDVIQKIC